MTTTRRRAASAASDVSGTLASWIVVWALALLTTVAAAWLIDQPVSDTALDALTVIAGATGAALFFYALDERNLRNGARALISRARLVLHTLGFRTMQRRELANLVGVGFLASTVSVATSLLVVAAIGTPQPHDERIDLYQGQAPWTAALSAALNAPLHEEILYRGPVLLLVALAIAPAWGRSHPHRATVATAALVVISSIAFALIHLTYSAQNAIAAGLAGLIWAPIALRHKSLLPVVLAHALHNIVWVLTSTS